MTEGNKCF